MPDPQILIVRHAESASNAGERTSDPASIPITGEGARQAQHVADCVEGRPTLVVTSCYLRTQQTAAPLLAKFPGVSREVWPIEEFTYLDRAACHNTTFEERAALRDEYWKRGDPEWQDGEGCESFSHFMARVREFERRLDALGPDSRLVAFTHGWVIQALVWREHHPDEAGSAEAMRAFEAFASSTPIPNCAMTPAAVIAGRVHVEREFTLPPPLDFAARQSPGS